MSASFCQIAFNVVQLLLYPTMPSVTFFVPCLNEEQNVDRTLGMIIEAASEVGVSHEILVVDDCSTDGTSRVVEDFREEHPQAPIELKRNPRNMGLGRCYVDGAFSSRGEYYMMVCGDNTRAKDTVVNVLRHLGEADMVIPHFGDSDHRTWFRRLLSRTFVSLVNVCSGNSIRYYNGLVLHRRQNVMRWRPESHGFGVHAELITRLLAEGASYVEVEVVNEEREFGRSSAFKLRNFISTASSLVKMLIRRMGGV